MQLHMHVDGMKPRSLVILITIVLVLNGFISLCYIDSATAEEVLPRFYVDDDYDSFTPGWGVDHFKYIQDAINASSSGDRILVYAGTYNETLTISHKIDLFGEDRDLVTITGTDSGDRLTISAPYVNISHFKIQNCGTGTNNAVIVINAARTIITDTIIESGGKHGILIKDYTYNTIYDNIIRSNSGDGINVNNSDRNSITYNSITSNSNNGLFLYNSSNNTVQYNSAIKSNSHNGIFLNETCNDNTISNNNFF